MKGKDKEVLERINLYDGWYLKRVINSAGVRYSAICTENDIEMYSAPTEAVDESQKTIRGLDEDGMLLYWLKRQKGLREGSES